MLPPLHPRPEWSLGLFYNAMLGVRKLARKHRRLFAFGSNIAGRLYITTECTSTLVPMTALIARLPNERITTAPKDK
jgi:hypothetical protein